MHNWQPLYILSMEVDGGEQKAKVEADSYWLIGKEINTKQCDRTMSMQKGEGKKKKKQT